MRIKLFLVIAILSLWSHTDVLGQSEDEQMINVLLKDLFDGMREGDSTKVASVFRADVSMWSSFTDPQGNQILRKGDLKQFLNAIGTPHEKVWDERLYNIKIELDDNVAQAWADYTFYIGEELSHCGVDAFHLVREKDHSWKIIHLLDTRRKENCVLEP